MVTTMVPTSIVNAQIIGATSMSVTMCSISVQMRPKTPTPFTDTHGTNGQFALLPCLGFSCDTLPHSPREVTKPSMVQAPSRMGLSFQTSPKSPRMIVEGWEQCTHLYPGSKTTTTY